LCRGANEHMSSTFGYRSGKKSKTQDLHAQY
jgi:hypothetical protein